MTVVNRWPQVGDDAVEFRAAGRSWENDGIGTPTRVKTITQTLVITADGARYNRAGLFPVSEGRQSARQLVPTSDPRVLCAQGRAHLRDLARQVNNLADIERKDPMDIVGAFAQVVSAAAAARTEYIALTSAASKAEQESPR